MKDYFLPRTDSKKSDWQHNLGDKLPTYKTKYGLSTTEVTDSQDGDKYFKYWLDVLGETDAFKRKVTAFKNELRDGVPAGATATLPPAVPVFAAAPTAVEPSIFSRSTALGNRIKKHKDYVVSDGNDMLLEGSEKPSPDVIDGQPVLKIVLKAGQPLIQWVKGLFDALYIEVDRGDGQGWKFLAVDTEPNLDTAALPAAATTWKYKAVYIFHDEKVAKWSNDVSISVKA
jgi:hypothetical protein